MRRTLIFAVLLLALATPALAQYYDYDYGYDYGYQQGYDPYGYSSNWWNPLPPASTPPYECPVYNNCPPGYTSSTHVNQYGCTVLECHQGGGSASLSAAPASGRAPLSVTLTADTNSGCNGGNFAIDYGDGTQEDTPIPADSCRDTITRTHVYQTAGTYTAVLLGTWCDDTRSGVASSCAAPSATVTVTSGGGGDPSASLSASPQSGRAPLAVSFSTRGSGSYTVDFGDGQSGAMQPTPGAIYPPEQRVSHTYTQAGTYTASLYDPGGCGPYADSRCLGAPAQYIGSVTITVTSGGGTECNWWDWWGCEDDDEVACTADAMQCSDGSWVGRTGPQGQFVCPTTGGGSGALSAAPASGPAPLSVSFSGDTNSGCNGGNFTLIFGDGQSTEIAIPADSCRDTFNNVSHTYGAAGTYTATLVSDWNNQALGSATVTVSGSGGGGGGGWWEGWWDPYQFFSPWSWQGGWWF